MKLIIDQDNGRLTIEDGGATREIDLYSDEGFELIAHQYVRVGWNQKQVYTYSWMGRPVIQLPDDMVRMQEVIYRLKPDLIIETGIAHGGSLIYYASLMEAMHHGHVLGIDIEIRPHNRSAIEAHEMSHRIDMIEGSSVAPETMEKVRAFASNHERVMVILDSNHTYDHVMQELELYAPLVSKGCYMVSTDGVMRDVVGVPRAGEGWATDNPANAAEDFAAKHPDFVIEQPEWPFSEATLTKNVTHYPSAWLKKL